MRRFFGLCLLVGWSLSGGACSTRALLQVRLTSDNDLPANGVPKIEVSGTQGAIRSVGPDNTPAIKAVIVEPGGDLTVGIYLPDDVRGDVTVQTSVVTIDDGCKIGEGDTKSVGVNPGGVTSVDVRIRKIDNPACPMMISPKKDAGGGDAGGDVAQDRGSPDGGVDLGEDRGTDGGREQMAEAGTDVGTDAGMEHATSEDAGEDHVCGPDAGEDLKPGPSCDDYCRLMALYCKDIAFPTDCQTTCGAWRVGTKSTADGNSVGCHLTFAEGVQANPMSCSMAGPSSAVCRDRADAGRD